MTLGDLQAQVWTLDAPPGATYVPDSAIAKKWLADKADTPLRGTPISEEIALDDGTTAQVFQSGQIAVYTSDASGTNVVVR